MIRLQQARLARELAKCAGASSQRQEMLAMRRIHAAAQPLWASTCTFSSSAAPHHTSSAAPMMSARGTTSVHRPTLLRSFGSLEQWCGTAAATRTSTRGIRVKGKEGEAETEAKEDEEAKKQTTEEGEEEGATGSNKKDQKKKEAPKRNSLGDHIRGLLRDFTAFPDIYNIANLSVFLLFMAFCLCSTGSMAEEEWWKGHWGVDDSFRPYTWLLHGILTDQFTAVSFAMMLLHPLINTLNPVLGTRGLLQFMAATTILSGGLMWAGNAIYYRDGKAPERQYGPWDVTVGLLLLQHYHCNISPVAMLNSYNGFMKFACWLGAILITYFDWQQIVAGGVVSSALYRGVPRFRVKI